MSTQKNVENVVNPISLSMVKEDVFAKIVGQLLAYQKIELKNFARQLNNGY